MDVSGDLNNVDAAAADPWEGVGTALNSKNGWTGAAVGPAGAVNGNSSPLVKVGGGGGVGDLVSRFSRELDVGAADLEGFADQLLAAVYTDAGWKELARRAGVKQADELEAEQEEQRRREAGERTGWEREDLSPHLDGTHTEVVPSVLHVRTPDQYRDRFVFYPGINWMHGDSGDGKSMLLAVTAAQVLAGGGVVLWIEYEESSPATLIARLLEMGVAREAIAGQLVYINPQTKATQRNLDQALAMAAAASPGGAKAVWLVVLDSVGEAFGVELINENNDAEVAPWVNRVLRSIVRALPCAAIVPNDHGTKAREQRLHPSGSKRKRAALTGISVLVEVEIPFSRGVPGASTVTCAKDRHGHYPKGAEIAVMSVSSAPASEDGRPSPPGSLRVDVHERGITDPRPPAAGANGGAGRAMADRKPPAAELMWDLMQAAVEAARTYSTSRLHGRGVQLSGNTLAGQIGIKAGVALKKDAIKWAVKLGALRAEKSGIAVHHEYVRDLSEQDQEDVYAAFGQGKNPLPDKINNDPVVMSANRRVSAGEPVPGKQTCSGPVPDLFP